MGSSQLVQTFLDSEIDQLIEDILYRSNRERQETLMSYITKKQQKRQDLRSALGFETFKCDKCQVDLSYNIDIPDELFVYLLYRGALLTEEKKRTLAMWEPARMNETRWVELLLKLERDHQAHFSHNSLTGLALGECPDYSQEPPASSGSASSVGPDGAYQDSSWTTLYASPPLRWRH